MCQYKLKIVVAKKNQLYLNVFSLPWIYNCFLKLCCTNNVNLIASMLSCRSIRNTWQSGTRLYIIILWHPSAVLRSAPCCVGSLREAACRVTFLRVREVLCRACSHHTWTKRSNGDIKVWWHGAVVALGEKSVRQQAASLEMRIT